MNRKVLRLIADKHQKASAFNAESVTRTGFAVALATVLTGCGPDGIEAGTDFKILKKEGENYSEIDINKGLPADFYVWVNKDKVEDNTNINFELGEQYHTIEWKDYSANNSDYQLQYDNTQGYVFNVNSIAEVLGVEQLTEGNYKFEIKQNDNEVEVTFNQNEVESITVDTTAPVINKLSIKKGEKSEEANENVEGTFYINSKTATITFEYDEPNFDSFAYSSNGNEKVDFNHNPDKGTITLGLSELAEGDNSISFTITDTAGNEITQEVKLFVDITGSTIGTPLVKKGEDLEVVTEDEGTFYINSQTAKIVLNFTEDNFASVSAKLDGNDVVSEDKIQVKGGELKTVTLDLRDLDEGEHSISFTITDKAGNVSTKDLTVEVDITVPQFYSKTMDLWGAGGLDWGNLQSATLNNEPIKTIPISDGKFDFYSDTLDYKPTNPNGENTFVFTFEDPSNGFQFPVNKTVYVKNVGLEDGVNIDGETYNVYYDNENEMSTNAFYSVTDDKFLLSNVSGKLKISGNIIDKNLSDLQYFIDGAGDSFIGKINDYNSFDHFEIPKALSNDDEFNVRVVATDKAGNTATAKWEDLQPTPENTANFKVDTKAPTIESITFSGQRKDKSDVYQIVELTNDITVQVSDESEVESVSITLPAGEGGSAPDAQTVILAKDPDIKNGWKASGVELPQGSRDSGYKKFLNGELLSDQITITATDLAGNTIDQKKITETTSKEYMFSIVPEIETVEIGGDDTFYIDTKKGLALNPGDDREFNLGSITFKDYQGLNTTAGEFQIKLFKVPLYDGTFLAPDVDTSPKANPDGNVLVELVRYDKDFTVDNNKFYALKVHSKDGEGVSEGVSGDQYLTVNVDSDGTVEYGSVWYANTKIGNPITKIGNPITEQEAINADYLFWVE